MQIIIPLQDRTAIKQIGELTPIETYTVSYRNFNDIPRNPRTGQPHPVSLPDTYIFKGSDVGLEDRCTVLVQANDPRDYHPDGFGYQPGAAYKILSETKTHRQIRRQGLNDTVACMIYEVESLAENIQLTIFKAMKRDKETIQREFKTGHRQQIF